MRETIKLFCIYKSYSGMCVHSGAFLHKKVCISVSYPEQFVQGFFMFARHGRALTGASPEHAQIVGSV